MENIDYSKYYWQNDKVRLRPIRMEDWKEYHHNLYDNEARFFLDSEIELPVDEQTAEQRWKNWLGDGFDKNNRIRLTIETLDGINVGGLNLNGIDERNGTFGIGMQINREFRGKGYGTSAMKILLDYAFNERRLNKYQCFVIEGNIASETMLKKLGCVKEGVIRGTTYHNGKYWNEIHYGLFAKEFNEMNRRDW
jgi:RimJ/RimL family protein N-acetyltransferase